MRPITATDLMNPNVLLVRDDMSLSELAAFFMDQEISGAPVEDKGGNVVGVVSVVDIVRAASGDGPGGTPDGRKVEDLVVADVMTPGVFAVSEDAEVSEIAATMIDHHLHRVLVTRDEEPVGIISTSDLLGLLIDEDEN